VDLSHSAEDLRFRDDVRAFLANNLPQDMRERTLQGHRADAQDTRQWQRTLHARGWGAVGWPRDYGGLGLSQVQQYLFEVECAVAGAPAQLPFGIKMLGPVLMHFGSPAQRAHFLPRILNGEHWWCQGYSEPGAGSDLASLKTQARIEGDHYIVNGQKAWNTLGQHADWIFCLVKTDTTVKPQRGISLLLIDMKSPGVTVRPTTLLDGTQEVNEIWLENVRVPLDQRVGAENDGWTCAKFLLTHERTNLAGIGNSRRELARLKEVATLERRCGRPLREDPHFRRRMAQVEIELKALEVTHLRVLSGADAKRSPGPESSVLKIRGSEIAQTISELLVEGVGIHALPFEPAVAGESLPGPAHARNLAASYLNLRKLSIYGGSNEIQKNIVAQSLLKL
jgi:alkylation response protein AidB-like acyl-CoA dehydrogenase